MQNEKVRPAKVRREGRRQEAKSNRSHLAGWQAGRQAGRSRYKGGGEVAKAQKVSLACKWNPLAFPRALQRGAKIIFPRLKFPPHFCQAKWPAHAQPIGPDGTCVTQLSSINFARPCILLLHLHRVIYSSDRGKTFCIYECSLFPDPCN